MKKQSVPKKPYPLAAVITADVLLLAVSLSVFCYFHHIKSLWDIGPDDKPASSLAVQTGNTETVSVSEEYTFNGGDFRDNLPDVFLPLTAQSAAGTVNLTDHGEITEYLTSSGLPFGHGLDCESQEYIGLYRSHDIFMTAEKIAAVIRYNDKTYNVIYYLYDVYTANLENLFTAHVSSRIPIEEMSSASYEIATSDGTFVTSPAILSVNGDYMGNDNHTLFAVRNSEIVRDSDYIGADICVIYEDGTFETIDRSEFDREAILEKNPYQVWEFGPSLLDDSSRALYDFNESFYDDNVISNRHPRSSIGYYEPGHYCFIVVDGRSEESQGMRLFQLGEIYEQLGVSAAYNLDGGDSSQSLWNGEKHRMDESHYKNGESQRELYDIVSIGEVTEK